MVSCNTADCPSVQVLCVCVDGRAAGLLRRGGGGGEDELTDCREEGREVGGGGWEGRGESRVMRWWG